jgi:hypothetical protein
MSVALACAIGAPLLLVGCQTNAQYDQAARDLRMQEDELYAMEDYVAQYQDLICKYRTENAALRRQLAGQGGAPTPATRTPVIPRPAPDDSDIEVPETPDVGTPPGQLDAPDVPPIGETTSLEFRDRSGPAVEDVVLRGEVIANDHGGPRLAIDVEPRDVAGQPTTFDGGISLMIVDPAADGDEKLARWDFRPKEVRAAMNSTSNGELQFQVELPADVEVPETAKLWLQLLPRGGGRLVKHADVNLQQPGTFASVDEATQHSGVRENPVVAAVYNEATEIPPVESEILDAGWTIAEPGKPGGMESDAENEEWRASLEPPPEAIATARPSISKGVPKKSQQARASLVKQRSSGWSPDRNGGSPNSLRTASGRPNWSANR